MSQNQGRGSPPGTPRWVKVFGILFILLILLVVIIHLMGIDFGNHRPFIEPMTYLPVARAIAFLL